MEWYKAWWVKRSHRRPWAVPRNPSLTAKSCHTALILLMNLYRQKTEAWKKGLALGPQGEWKDSVKGLGTPGASRCVLGPTVRCSSQVAGTSGRNGFLVL